MAASTEPPQIDPAPNRILRRQLWIGLATVVLMACSIALALAALTMERALHERYDDALALAQVTLEMQQAAADLRRHQVRFALRLASDGAQSKAAEAALRAVTDTRAQLDRLLRGLRAFDARRTGPDHIARIEAALGALAQTDQDVREEVFARRIEPGAARDRLFEASERALAEIDTAARDLVAATHERTDQAAARALEYGEIARRGLLAVGPLTLVLSGLLGYVGWRAMRSNERLLTQLNQLAHEDALTGAVNRRGLDERLPVEMARASRIAYPLAVVMIDLDHFKRFNDRRGHQAGDQLLRGAVAAWRTRLRPMDMLARYGGEEFTLVLPACDAEHACALIDRLRPLTPDRQTFSAGVAKWNGTDSAEELLRGADAALLQAKKGGRNRTIVWGYEPQVTLPLTSR
ncbi:MAG: diguanylate cyclase domain-containing protein [Gemmatimonadota bacterium]